MAGISISSIVGDNGVVEKARLASDETRRAEIKEELELKLLNLQVEKEKNGESVTKKDIADEISSLQGIEIDITGNKIEGEYNEFGYEIDENYKVTVSKRLKGEKPTGRIEITEEQDLEEVEIKVYGFLEGGSIVKIEALNGAELKEEKNSGESIFIVRDNSEYSFRIRGNNGRMTTISCIVNNAIPVRDDLITAISMINSSGERKVKVIGKTNSDNLGDEVIYSLDVIRYEGKMVLDGSSKFEGSSLSGTTYSFGKTDDISINGKEFAKNTVVLKVEGDLVVNSGITLTSVKNNFGGPKGLIIYCTGTFTNNGIVQMNSAGAYAKGDNVYLLKNSDIEYQFVPIVGRKGWKWCKYKCEE